MVAGNRVMTCKPIRPYHTEGIGISCLYAGADYDLESARGALVRVAHSLLLVNMGSSFVYQSARAFFSRISCT